MGKRGKAGITVAMENNTNIIDDGSDDDDGDDDAGEERTFGSLNSC